jgi:alanine racemase
MKKYMFQEIKAEISLSALKNNLKQVVARIGQKKIIAVVKADAYGHGAIAVSKALIKTSPQVAMLGVASLDEGIILRGAGIRTPILLMTGCPPESIPELVQYRLTPAVYNAAMLPRLSRYAKKKGSKIAIHLKVDTGMGRLGISPEEAAGFIQKSADLGIAVEGVFSHFADADLANLAGARLQLARLQAISQALKENEQAPYCHIANSAAIIQLEEAHFGHVRPGLMLYGYSPLQKESPSLHPVMTLKSRVVSLKRVPAGTAISYGQTFITKRETLVAGIAIGYADGYPRLLSNQGFMIAKGKRVPIIGRVCMDITLLDVTSAPPLAVGDWITVIGKEGNEAVWANELADKTGTIVYEILCGINPRISRQWAERTETAC